MSEQQKGLTPQEMQERSQKKVNQIHDFMETLQVRAEAREHVSREGFITKVVYWIDEEKYPAAEPEVTQTQNDPSKKDS